jgi:hypothetical protein
MKECFKCKKEKPLSDFYKHPQMKDGRVNKCKECNKADVRKNRADNIDYYRAYDCKRGSRQTDEYRKRYNRDNPIKYGARTMVSNAVRDGRLSKPHICSAVGCESTGRLHGHHEDYSKPLEVRWLCPPCHFAWHGKHGEGLNG